MCTVASASDCFQDSEFQAKSRKLITLCNDLRKMDVGHIIKIPTVVVCGDQSSGKSSIIQRICGVDLPRNTGTCTRCPMEVRMMMEPPPASTSSGSTPGWACTLKICRHRLKADGTVAAGDAREERFGPRITKKEDVAEWVRCAQAAVLNPSKPAAGFNTSSPCPGAGDNELKFSRDVVILEVQGAGVNLTLMDLPGLIHSTEKAGDEHYPELIRKLTLDYIAKDQTIIVMAVTMVNDLENQTIYSLAKEVDPQLRRTMGVLTKADLVEDGCHDGWLQVLKGTRYGLALGWHVVRNPSKSEVDARMTYEDANTKEHVYFQCGPWASVPQQLFGVPHLMHAMSHQLTRWLDKNLPATKQLVDDLFKKAKDDLLRLPPAVGLVEKRSMLTRLIGQLCRDMAAAVVDDAGPADTEFAGRLLKAFSAFRGGVLAYRLPYELRRSDPSGGVLGLCAVYSNRGGLSVVLVDDEQQEAEHMMSKASVLGVIHGEAALAGAHNTRPYAAVVRVIKNLQGGWRQPAEDCIEAVASLLVNTIRTKVAQHFGRFEPLERLLRTICTELVEVHQATALQRVMEIVEMEGMAPYTNNDEAFSAAHDAFCKLLAVARRGVAAVPAAPTQDEVYNLFKHLASGSTHALAVDECQMSSLSTDNAKVVDVVASALAYFKVSSKRFQDMVPMAIRFHPLKAYGTAVEDTLMARAQMSMMMPFGGGGGAAVSAERVLPVDSESFASNGHRDTASVIGVDPGQRVSVSVLASGGGWHDADSGDSASSCAAGGRQENLLDLMAESADLQRDRAALEARVRSLRSIRAVLAGY